MVSIRSSPLRVIAVMFTIVFMCQILSFTNIFAATYSESSAIRLEREALLKSGWWSNNISRHCYWTGITCNPAGSITSISLYRTGLDGELGQFNFSCFQNLEHFDVWINNLSGIIPAQVGALSKLTYLDLGSNHFTGQQYYTNFLAIFIELN